MPPPYTPLHIGSRDQVYDYAEQFVVEYPTGLKAEDLLVVTWVTTTEITVGFRSGQILPPPGTSWIGRWSQDVRDSVTGEYFRVHQFYLRIVVDGNRGDETWLMEPFFFGGTIVPQRALVNIQHWRDADFFQWSAGSNVEVNQFPPVVTNKPNITNPDYYYARLTYLAWLRSAFVDYPALYLDGRQNEFNSGAYDSFEFVGTENGALDFDPSDTQVVVVPRLSFGGTWVVVVVADIATDDLVLSSGAGWQLIGKQGGGAPVVHIYAKWDDYWGRPDATTGFRLTSESNTNWTGHFYGFAFEGSDLAEITLGAVNTGNTLIATPGAIPTATRPAYYISWLAWNGSGVVVTDFPTNFPNDNSQRARLNANIAVARTDKYETGPVPVPDAYTLDGTADWLCSQLSISAKQFLNLGLASASNPPTDYNNDPDTGVFYEINPADLAFTKADLIQYREPRVNEPNPDCPRVQFDCECCCIDINEDCTIVTPSKHLDIVQGEDWYRGIVRGSPAEPGIALLPIRVKLKNLRSLGAYWFVDDNWTYDVDRWKLPAGWEWGFVFGWKSITDYYVLRYSNYEQIGPETPVDDTVYTDQYFISLYKVDTLISSYQVTVDQLNRGQFAFTPQSLLQYCRLEVARGHDNQYRLQALMSESFEPREYSIYFDFVDSRWKMTDFDAWARESKLFEIDALEDDVEYGVGYWVNFDSPVSSGSGQSWWAGLGPDERITGQPYPPDAHYFYWPTYPDQIASTPGTGSLGREDDGDSDCPGMLQWSYQWHEEKKFPPDRMTMQITWKDEFPSWVPTPVGRPDQFETPLTLPMMHTEGYHEHFFALWPDNPCFIRWYYRQHREPVDDLNNRKTVYRFVVEISYTEAYGVFTETLWWPFEEDETPVDLWGASYVLPRPGPTEPHHLPRGYDPFTLGQAQSVASIDVTFRSYP